MTDLDTIEKYVNGLLPPDERTRFEAELATNPSTAETLAFYVLTAQVARQQALDARKAELAGLRTQPAQSERIGIRPLWTNSMRWVAAAASIVLVVAVGYYALRPAPDSLAPLAETYTEAHFSQLPVRMGGETDLVQRGISLFNDGRIAQADSLFAAVLATQPTRDDALTYAGIAAFQQGQYDLAIDRFQRLAQWPGLFANPGRYYEALTRLRRNLPMDKSTAKGLLQQVVQRNLAGAKEAEKLLKTNQL